MASLKNIADDIPDEVFDELENVKQEWKRAQIAHDIAGLKRLVPFYASRRPTVSKIPKFWPTVLTNHIVLEEALQHRDDLVAISHLTDVWIERNVIEPRAFTIEFHFSENPYFSDTVLKKEYKPDYGLTKPSHEPGQDGVSEAMLEFDWDAYIQPRATKIHWKSDAKNLTKLYPQKTDEDDADDILDSGSFFNWFEHEGDPQQFGHVFDDDLFPQAIDYFMGKGSNSRNKAEQDSDDEDEEDEEDENGEIDLERPKKKAKRG